MKSVKEIRCEICNNVLNGVKCVECHGNFYCLDCLIEKEEIKPCKICGTTEWMELGSGEICLCCERHGSKVF